MKNLADIFLFKDCQEAVGAVKEIIQSYKKGDVIYNRTDFKRAIGVVLTGRLKAVSQNNTTLSVFLPGAVFGAAAVFSNDCYVSNIIALSDSTVQFIYEEELLKLFKEYPQISVNYISFLSRKIRYLNGKISVFTQNSAAGKLYCYLQSNAVDGALPANAKMANIANTIGIGRTSLYRALETLENENLIVRKDGKVILL